MKNPHYIPPEMVFVQGGKMQLGEKRELAVDLPDFWIGKYPVTNEEFVHFLNAEGNQEEGGKKWCLIDGHFGIEALSNGTFQLKIEKRKHPVVQVSWYGIKAYCRWLNKQIDNNYSLPSGIQWEYAARGGQKSKDFEFSGGCKLKEVGWYSKNSHSGTKPVGLKIANELGLYDMSGNVWEWCLSLDNYDFSKNKNNGNSQDNSLINFCVTRGGSWVYDSNFSLIAYSELLNPNYHFHNFGFRVIHT